MPPVVCSEMKSCEFCQLGEQAHQVLGKPQTCEAMDGLACKLWQQLRCQAGMHHQSLVETWIVFDCILLLRFVKVEGHSRNHKDGRLQDQVGSSHQCNSEAGHGRGMIRTAGWSEGQSCDKNT